MKTLLRGFWADSLLRNSIYLMLATFVMAFFSFLFWLASSQFFSPAHVGIATTLIAVMHMIALLSLVGFDTVFIRFLPKTDERNTTINTGLVVVALAAVLTSGIFLIFADRISPALGFINDGIWMPLAFIVFSVMTALNILTDAIFLAYKKAKYTFIINAIFTSLRLLLLFILVGWGFLGIFFAVALSQAIGLLLSVVALSKKLDHSAELRIDRGVLSRVLSYSGGNYVAGILNLLPATILPIMITNHLGPEHAAFFGIAMMIGHLLYAIPYATTRALFAEGSHEPTDLSAKARKAFAITGVLLIPSILILCFFGQYFLSFFGKEYSIEGFRFLQFIAVTGIAVSVLSVLETFFRVIGNTQWLILINTFYLGTIWILGYLLLPYGLVGIGIAWLAGHLVASAVSYTILLLRRTVSS